MCLTPNDPYYSTYGSWDQDYLDLYGMHIINASKAWDITTGDSDIVVAVVDSGILFKHPDLKGSGNVLPGYDFISDPAAARDGDGRDPP